MEIERKFLVCKLPRNLDELEKKELVQAYISFSPTIRLRKSDSDYFLTCKTKGQLARDEWEIKISEEDFSRLWKKTEPTPIEKTRYLIPLYDKLVAELDIYHGFFEGLKTVEVEFETIEDAENFVAPSWFGKDVTYESRYKNGSLSRMTEDEARKISAE